MQIEFVGIVTVLIGLFAFYRRPSFIVTAFVLSTLLGSSAAMILDALGGASIPPAHVMILFLVTRLMIEPEIRAGIIASCRFPNPGFWLLITLIYSLIGAVFMPRLFADATRLFPVRASGGYILTPLAPATSNLTQSVYFISNFVCFAALSGYFRTEQGKTTFAKAAIAAATLNLVFAVLDLATYATGTAELLAFIRNANYRMLDDSELAGFKRIVGSFAEASVFGSTTLAYFAFVLQLWLRGISPRLTLTLSIFSLAGILFATSTTGYVGLAVFLAFSYLRLLIQVLTKPVTYQTLAAVILGPAAAFVLILSLALNQEYWSYLSDTLDTLIFNKMSTQSGVERSSWNTQAMQNFYDTYGLGAGNGSLRASSFPVAVLASLGVIGAALYFIFIASVLLPRRRLADEDIRSIAFREAAQSACFCWIVAATIAGAFVDIGLFFFVFAARACASPSFQSQTLRRPRALRAT